MEEFKAQRRDPGALRCLNLIPPAERERERERLYCEGEEV